MITFRFESSEMRKPIGTVNWELSWMGLLGLGVGVLVGVVLASGANFSSEDTARFLGSFFGSLIAVAGAVSLHFLKESSSVRGRRHRMRELLTRLQKIQKSTILQIEEGNEDTVVSHLRIADRYLNHIKKYCDAHFAEDDRISYVGAGLDNLSDGHYASLFSETGEFEDIKDDLIQSLNRKDGHFSAMIEVVKRGIQ